MKMGHRITTLILFIAIMLITSLFFGTATAETPIKKYEKANEQYQVLKSKYEDAKVNYENVKEDYDTAKLKFKSLKDNESRDELKDRTKEYLESSIDYIISYLELMKNRVESSDNNGVIPFDASGKINTHISQLEGIREKVQQTNTSEKLVDSARELEDLWIKAYLEVRYYNGLIINYKIDLVLKKEDNASEKMRMTIEQLKNEGKDTSKLEQNVSNFNKYMREAKQIHQNSLQLYVNNNGFDSNGALTNKEAAQALILEATNSQKETIKKLKNASEQLSYVSKEVKELKKYIIPTATIIPIATVPSNVSPAYKDFNTKITSWLDKRIVEWKQSKNKPMNFATYHIFASDDMFVKTNAEFDMKFLDILEEANSSIIVLYIRPTNYFSQKERYKALISKIRSDGKKLFIGARFDNVPMDLRMYDAELIDFTKNIIAVINPDYYGIVIEPSTMENKHGFNASDEEWIELIRKNSELSKQLSPNTKTVVAGHKEELGFVRLASDLDELDIIGFNIYDANGIYPEYSGYLGKGDVVGKTIDYANSRGKETWILETWVTDITASEDKRKLGAQEFMKPIDAKWIKGITYYAQMHNMSAVTPFFTGKFVSYTEDPKIYSASLNNNERTPVFYMYEELIQEFQIP